MLGKDRAVSCMPEGASGEGAVANGQRALLYRGDPGAGISCARGEDALRRGDARAAWALRAFCRRVVTTMPERQTRRKRFVRVGESVRSGETGANSWDSG